MIVQGLNNIASAYGASYKSAIGRQTSPAPTANYADKVTLSVQGKALAADSSALRRCCCAGVMVWVGADESAASALP